MATEQFFTDATGKYLELVTLADGRVIDLVWTTTSASTAFVNHSGIQNCSGCSVRVLSEIKLPNGRSWKFQYASNSYAQLTKVILPTGGYIRYAYARQPQFVRWEDGATLSDALAVTGRFESPDGVTEHSRSFSYQTTVLNNYVTQRVLTQIDSGATIKSTHLRTAPARAIRLKNRSFM